MPATSSGARAAQAATAGTPRRTPARQTRTGDANAIAEAASDERLRVLHVGSGSVSATRLHPIFRLQQWDEVRLDIDASTNPDISGSIVDMTGFAEDESCDAIWASHVLEHLLQHEVGRALSEFRRVLVPGGFALIRTPDIEAVAQFVLDGRIRDVIYTSPAGPITPLDMIYGHGASIARGAHAMRHGTAFTADSMAQQLIEAGFAELRVTRTDTFEVWAAAFMPEADIPAIVDDLARTGIDLRT